MKSFTLTLALGLALTAPVLAESYIIDANGKLPSDLEGLVTAAGGTLVRLHDEIDVAIAVSEDSGFAAALEASSNKLTCLEDQVVQWTPELTGAEVVTMPTGHTSIDPTTALLFPCQWNLRQIDAPGAWAQDAFGDPNVKVAVLDSGVDPFHIDLAGKVDLAQSASFLTPGSSICNSVLGLPDEETFFDFRFHGTFVASQITTNNLGMAGVAPLTEIVAVKVLNCLGSGSFGELIAGILYAASLDDVDVINMSLGAYFDRTGGAGPLLGPLAKAVNHAGSQGKLMISASGNDFADLDHDGSMISLPAQSGSGISIYATAVDDSRALYANHGVSGTWVGAPGGDSPNPNPPIPGCLLSLASQSFPPGACSSTSVFFNCGSGASYLAGSGTSFAAPIVAGVAALVDGQHGGAKNPAQLKTTLKNTADDLGAPGTDNEFSHGRVNAAAAVQ